MPLRISVVTAVSAALLANPASAEEAAEIVEEVIVVAHPLSGEGLSQAAELLQGEELARLKDANIGATLGTLPGIHSAQFGNAVGRPVIHGLGGPRIRIMEDRIDTMDVSVTSADHATAVEPFIAERVEVLKGPSTLLYGSGAIGGVVDVHTARIPHELAESVWGGIETRTNDNTHGTSTAAKLNGALGKFAWHLDGAWKDGDDYEIPGFAESARLRAAEAPTPGEEEDEEARGQLPGSHYDSEAYAAGASYIGGRGFFGVAVSRIEADYGLPGGHEHEAGEEEQAPESATPTLDMEQTRTDAEFGLRDPFRGFTSLNIRFGHNDYEHTEIEPNGEPATEFTNEAWELRAELVYGAGERDGAFGLQHQQRKFSAIGEEAFIAPVDTVNSGIFWVGQRAFKNFDLETGLRIGRVEHDPSEFSSDSFTTWAASLGAVIPMGENWLLGLSVDGASRAPVAEELYSDGPHLVTNAYEIGNPDIDNERALNFSATLEHQSERWNATLTAYATEFSDFIYEAATGATLDGLPVFAYEQNDARFLGLDAKVAVTLTTWDGGDLVTRLQFDVVEAELDVRGDTDLPRIPPSRFGGGIDVQHGRFSVSIDYLRANSQGDVRPGELPSDAYDDLRAYLGIDWEINDRADLTLFVQGRNLTDDEQRLHTSFIKDIAPAPGRSVEAGLRLSF